MQLSSHLSEISYFASCFAFLKFSKYLNESDSQKQEEEIKRKMMPSEKTGLSILIELRSMCDLVRSQEARPPLYSSCKNHKNVEY